jgi:predicted ATP-grasp superfamily ATP-dependent carboligase
LSKGGSIDTSVAAVVLNLSDHGSVGVARSLGRLGVEVHGVHHGVTAAARSRYFRQVHRSPADVGTSAVVPFLQQLGQRLGGRPVLIPTGDASSMVVDEHAEELRPRFRFPSQPPGLARQLYEKKGMHDLCLEFGIPTPRTEFPKCRADVDAYLAHAVFPVVVKPIDAWRLQARTGHRMAIAGDEAELLRWYDELEDPDEPNLMLQEYIPGHADSVWMLNGYYDSSSTARFAVTGRKLRQCPPDTGSTSVGICLANPTVEALTADLMKRTGYQGILDLGYRFDRRDRQYKLLDVNPRLGATFRLFVGPDGMDVVRALYLDLTDQAVPQSRAVPGRMWLVETNDVRSFVQLRSEGRLGGLAWLRSLRRVDETAWWAIDDVRPFAAALSDLIGRALRRLIRRLGGGDRGGSAAQDVWRTT